jgi:hypothetical protein
MDPEHRDVFLDGLNAEIRDAIFEDGTSDT